MLGAATEPREGALGACKCGRVILCMRCIVESKCPFSGHDCEMLNGAFASESLRSAVTFDVVDASEML